MTKEVVQNGNLGSYEAAEGINALLKVNTLRTPLNSEIQDQIGRGLEALANLPPETFQAMIDHLKK